MERQTCMATLAGPRRPWRSPLTRGIAVLACASVLCACGDDEPKAPAAGLFGSDDAVAGGMSGDSPGSSTDGGAGAGEPSTQGDQGPEGERDAGEEPTQIEQGGEGSGGAEFPGCTVVDDERFEAVAAGDAPQGLATGVFANRFHLAFVAQACAVADRSRR